MHKYIEMIVQSELKNKAMNEEIIEYAIIDLAISAKVKE